MGFRNYLRMTPFNEACDIIAKEDKQYAKRLR